MKKKILIFGIISIGYIIFFPIFFNYFIYPSYTLEISSSGTKNREAQGYEVWINRILIDGRETDLAQYPLAEGWEYNGRLFSSGTEKQSLILKVHAKENIMVEFISHPYSGIIEIKDHQNIPYMLDLYSDNEHYITREFYIKSSEVHHEKLDH